MTDNTKVTNDDLVKKDQQSTPVYMQSVKTPPKTDTTVTPKKNPNNNPNERLAGDVNASATTSATSKAK